MPKVKDEALNEDPPVVKTKLHFKRTASGSSSSNHKRRKQSHENRPSSSTNGVGSKTNRQPDFDFTNDDDNALPKVSKVFWPDKYTFKDALFSAISDPDDATHWAQVFGSEIHIYPRPLPTMSDDEYANWVREQVYGHVLREGHRKRMAQAEQERLRQQAKARQQQEERERKFYEQSRKEQEAWSKYFEEHLRQSASGRKTSGSTGRDSARNLRSQAPLQRWKDYFAAFQPPPPDANLDLLLLWQQSDVPWPTPSGLEKDISEANIRSFIKTYAMKYSEQAAGDWKKAVKQSQYFWHPDKFRQIQARKLERLSEEKKEEIMQRVTEVSQILNKLAKEQL
jgi:hypothetical protein